jgi:hypothetical protein
VGNGVTKAQLCDARVVEEGTNVGNQNQFIKKDTFCLALSFFITM